MNPVNQEYLTLFLEKREYAERSKKNYQIILKFLDRFLNGKNFKQISEEDMRRFIRTRNQVKISTRNKEKKLLKNFFRHLSGYRKYTYPPCVEWMNGITTNKTVLPVVNANNLLTENDVKALIEASYSIRDRALWMVLWEGGLRLGEALNMKKDSIIFDQYGCYTVVSGKTGQRRLRLVQSTSYLREYLNSHPEGQNWLWFSNQDRQLSESTVRLNLRRCAIRAGLKKKVWPHLFRHSRLTVNARFMTESELCIFAGWRMGSPQTRVYVHLSGIDLDGKILEHYGLKELESQEKNERLLSPLSCPRCREKNPATNKYCFRCGSYLTLEEAIRLEKDKERELQELKDKMVKIEQNLKQFMLFLKSKNI